MVKYYFFKYLADFRKQFITYLRQHHCTLSCISALNVIKIEIEFSLKQFFKASDCNKIKQSMVF
jgi:hypothetical protein